MSVPVQAAEVPDLPSPPFIAVDGIPNFRDLGGYAISSSPNHSVRTRTIYRSGEPSRVTKDGILTIQNLGITHVYDLRSNVEIERAVAAGRGGVVEWEGCERVFVPIFPDADYSPERMALAYKNYAADGTEGFVQAYTDILVQAPSSYKKILLHIANEPQNPLVIHCTAGKDRTGLICALVLSICGVDDQTIAQEYSLTEIGLPSQWKDAVIEHLMDNPHLKGNKAGAINMISAKSANMLATLEMIRKKFGGAEGYMIEKCGLTKDEVEKIRSNLIVEKPAIHQSMQQSV